jgi:glycosyltransferase involved in cell wall biosynthesis
MMNSWYWKRQCCRRRISNLLLHPDALKDCRGWHATSREEADVIGSLGYKQPICIAPGGLDAPSPAAIEGAQTYWRAMCPSIVNRSVALFHSRFHGSRRVLDLIDIWLRHAPKDWLLLMVGYPQEYSIAQLSDYILRNSGQGRVEVFDASGAPPPYAIASLFLLPSYKSNTYQAVAEALIHGLPSLVTDQPTWDHINETDFGWCGQWEQFGEALKDSLALGPEQLRSRGLLAKSWAIEKFSWSITAKTLGDFYKSLIT